MTQQIEAMKRWLDVIESHIEKFDSEQFTSICELDPAKEAAEELRQAIEQAQKQEPVGRIASTVKPVMRQEVMLYTKHPLPIGTALYTKDIL